MGLIANTSWLGEVDLHLASEMGKIAQRMKSRSIENAKRLLAVSAFGLGTVVLAACGANKHPTPTEAETVPSTTSTSVRPTIHLGNNCDPTDLSNWTPTDNPKILSLEAARYQIDLSTIQSLVVGNANCDQPITAQSAASSDIIVNVNGLDGTCYINEVLDPTTGEPVTPDGSSNQATVVCFNPSTPSPNITTTTKPSQI